MMYNHFFQLLALSELANVIIATPMTWGFPEDHNNESTPTNITERPALAAQILDFQQYDEIEAERNYTTKGSDEKPRQMRDNATDIDGFRISVHNTSDVISSDTPIASGRPFDRPASVSFGTVTEYPESTTSRKSKRTLPQQLRVNGVTWPIMTEGNITLSPIQRMSLNTIKTLCQRAKKTAVAKYATDDDWYVKSGTYNISFGYLTLAMRAYGDAATKPGHLHWADFGILADWVYYRTLTDDYPKSYVGNIASGDNSTIWADWALSWRLDDQYKPVSELKHVFGEAPAGSSATSSGGNNKRSLDSSSSAKIVSRDTNPIVLQIAQTGFQLALNYGTAVLSMQQAEHILKSGRTGVAFDEMVAKTVGNKVFDMATHHLPGPYYLEGHYLPPWLARSLEHGMHFTFKRDWAADPKKLFLLFETLYEHVKQSWADDDTKLVYGVKMQSFFGEIIEPAGGVIGWFSVGQDIVGAMGKIAYQYVVNPDDALTIGKFIQFHDEL